MSNDLELFRTKTSFISIEGLILAAKSHRSTIRCHSFTASETKIPTNTFSNTKPNSNGKLTDLMGLTYALNVFIQQGVSRN